MSHARRRIHRRAEVETFERRLLLAGVTLAGAPRDIASLTTSFPAFAIAPIGLAGNYVVAYPKSNELFAQILGADGATVRSEFQISSSTADGNVSRFDEPSISIDASGNCYIAYVAANGSDFADIYVAKIDGTGNSLAGPVPIAADPTGTQRSPVLAVSDSRLGVAYVDRKSSFGNNSSIFITLLDPATLNITAPARNLTTPPTIPQPNVADVAPDIDVHNNIFYVTNLRQQFNAHNQFVGQSLQMCTVSDDTTDSDQFPLFATPTQAETLGIPYVEDEPTGTCVYFSRDQFNPDNVFQYQSTTINKLFVGTNPASPTGTVQVLANSTSPEQIGIASVSQVAATNATPRRDFVALSKGTHDASAGLKPTTTGGLFCDAADTGPGATPVEDFLPTDKDVTFTTTGGTNGQALVVKPVVAGSGLTLTVDVATLNALASIVKVDLGDGDDITEGGVRFQVRLSAAPTAPVTVRVSTVDLTDANAARANVDYTPRTTQFILAVAGAVADFDVLYTRANLVASGRLLTVGVEVVSGPATVRQGTGTFLIEGPEDTDYYRMIAVFDAIASPPAPGQTLKTSVSLQNTSTTSAPAPTGSGRLRATLTFPGLSPVTLYDIPLKLNLKPGATKSIPVTTKLPSPLPTGTAAVSVSFTADSSSALKTGNISASVAAGSETLTVTNKFSNGATLVAGDADGTLAVFSLKGPGTGELVKNSDGSTDLVLTGTTAATKVSVKLSPVQPAGNEGRFNVRNITSNSAIGSVDAPNIDTAGNITLGGPITKGTFGQVKDDHLITLAAGSIPATLSFINLQNVTFTSGQPIKSLALNSWLDTDATPDTFSAPSIAALIVKGHLQSSLTLTGALGTATIGGDFTGSLSASSIKSLTVKSVLGSPLPASPSRVFATTSIGKVSAGAARNLFFSAGTRSGLTTLPTSSADFLSTPSSIAAFSITGIPNETSLFSNTILAARTLGPVQIKGLTPSSPNTPPTPFGIRALSIASYTQGTIKAKMITTPTTLDTSTDFSAATLG